MALLHENLVNDPSLKDRILGLKNNSMDMIDGILFYVNLLREYIEGSDCEEYFGIITEYMHKYERYYDGVDCYISDDIDGFLNSIKPINEPCIYKMNHPITILYDPAIVLNACTELMNLAHKLYTECADIIDIMLRIHEKDLKNVQNGNICQAVSRFNYDINSKIESCIMEMIGYLREIILIYI